MTKNPNGTEAPISSRDLEAGGDRVADPALSAIPADVRERIGADVASIPEIQEQLLEACRKAAARLAELGQPYYYYENMEGGHAAAANLPETARRMAMEYVYATQRLVD